MTKKKPKLKFKLKKKKSKYKTPEDQIIDRPIPIDPQPRTEEPKPLALAPRKPREWDPEEGDEPTERFELTMEHKTRLPIFSGPPVATDEEIRKAALTPGVHCSVCSIGIECPEFKEGDACAYKEAFKAFPSRSQESVIEAFRMLVDKNKERLLRAFHYEEQVNGGALDSNISRQVGDVLKQLETLLEMDRESKKATLKAESTQKTGILTKLFGGGSEKKALEEPKTEVVEAKAEVVNVKETVNRDGK